MTTKRNADGTINFANLGAASEAIEEGRKVKAARNMTDKQRADAARNRVYWDIPAELEERVNALAAAVGVPDSQIARWLLEAGLRVTTDAELIDARQPSRSMRFEFTLYPNGAAKRGR